MTTRKKFCRHHGLRANGECKRGFELRLRPDDLRCCYPFKSRYLMDKAVKPQPRKMGMYSKFTVMEIKKMAKDLGLKNVGKRDRTSLVRGIVAKKRSTSAGGVGKPAALIAVPIPPGTPVMAVPEPTLPPPGVRPAPKKSIRSRRTTPAPAWKAASNPWYTTGS